MAEGTRLKGQQAIDRLQEEMHEFRTELADLHHLKQEVQGMKSELEAIPLMDKKLGDMELNLQGMLQQILKKTAPPTPPLTDPSGSSRIEQQEKQKGVVYGEHSTVLPVTNLQSAFQQVQSTTQPYTFPTVSIPSSLAPVYTDNTLISTVKEGAQASGPFRISPPTILTISPPTLLPKPPYTMQQQIPQQQTPQGNFGYYNSLIAPQYIPAHMYNPVTGQYVNGNAAPSVYQSGVQLYNDQRNTYATQLGGPSYYAEAVLKGPRLEIPLFSGEDPIGWLIACEKFYDMTGTPYE